MNCYVCAVPLAEPLYEGGRHSSLTSLCTVQDQETRVFACARCGHVQTPPLRDLDEYYSSAYRILIESEEEDQLYVIRDGQKIFRAEHQAATLLDLLDLPEGALVLDYGAAKGATVKRVLKARPDVVAHFFDVSEMYVPFWRNIVDEDRFACFDRPDAWVERFDAVVSFFVLEHVQDPRDTLEKVRELLAPGGRYYFVVPNTFTNTADFVVVDHVNHFSVPSLEWLLHDAGFVVETIDAEAHTGAFVVVARRPVDNDIVPAPATPVGDVLEKAAEIASYWQGIVTRVEAMAGGADGPVAIYGAGFYGSFIASCLPENVKVEQFVDQNPFLQGTTHLGRDVVAPESLAPGVTDVFVGLNPAAARSIVEGIDAWRESGVRFHFL
jgi:SAM-dependent methyltransferase